MGMSDRVPGATTLETRMDDIRAVMDAVGSERPAVLGESEGGPLALLFYPLKGVPGEWRLFSVAG